MEHFDFVLFENYMQATHHLYDVELIARLLAHRGKKVAIFDIYHLFEDEFINGIPILHWKPTVNYPDDSWMKKKHSKCTTIIKLLQQSKVRHRYMKEARLFIQDKADNFYCGSYHNGMSVEFFDMDKPCYWWGLRSDRLRITWKKIIFPPFVGFRIIYEKKKFLKNPKQRLFISNDIIKEEHFRLGIPYNRMVIREERCIDIIRSPNLQKLSQEVSFLVIGMLRPGKNIPFTVDAFLAANIKKSKLRLVGRSTERYEKIIAKSIKGHNNIEREDRFLNYGDFNKAFIESHFVCFADEQGPSCITNGTMMEALINCRPVICPDYEPYKSYIEKFGVGILYEGGNIHSYANALVYAAEIGTVHFISAINNFLETILFDRVSKAFVDSINKINNCYDKI